MKCKITDIKPDVFKELLRFMYTRKMNSTELIADESLPSTSMEKNPEEQV